MSEPVDFRVRRDRAPRVDLTRPAPPEDVQKLVQYQEEQKSPAEDEQLPTGMLILGASPADTPDPLAEVTLPVDDQAQDAQVDEDEDFDEEEDEY